MLITLYSNLNSNGYNHERNYNNSNDSKTFWVLTINQAQFEVVYAINLFNLHNYPMR